MDLTLYDSIKIDDDDESFYHIIQLIDVLNKELQ